MKLFFKTFSNLCNFVSFQHFLNSFLPIIFKFSIFSEEFNNLVAGVSLARWDAKNDGPLYSIGLYYCKEEYRGKGYGKQVFDAIMDIVGDDTCALFSGKFFSRKNQKISRISDFQQLICRKSTRKCSVLITCLLIG